MAYDGELPRTLLRGIAGDEGWHRCPSPFDSIELMRVEEGGVEDPDGFAIGCRGRMTEDLRKKLIKLAPDDEAFEHAIDQLYDRTHRENRGGKFLARFVNTAGEVFQNVYVFAAVRTGMPHDTRETFVVVCGDRRIDFHEIGLYGNYWFGQPFAGWETDKNGERVLIGQMESLLELSEGKLLTDNFAPVDSLLEPVFESYEN